jgi:hypothetical protein
MKRKLKGDSALKNKIPILIFALACLTLSSARAWTEGCYCSIAEDAINLMPENLNWLINRDRISFEAGLMQKQPGSHSTDELIHAVLSDADTAAEMIKAKSGFEQAVKTFGRMARMIASSCTLLPDEKAVSSTTLRTDYDIYIEKHRKNFWIRWPGIGKRPRSAQQLTDLIKTGNERIKTLSGILIKTFETERKPVESYDLRSVPYGAGSISYSLATTTIAMSWLYAWDKAGGVKHS